MQMIEDSIQLILNICVHLGHTYIIIIVQIIELISSFRLVLPSNWSELSRKYYKVHMPCLYSMWQCPEEKSGHVFFLKEPQ